MFNRQLAFNRAVLGLNAQKAFSFDELTGCMYRSPDGNKCAVGMLIPDEKYNPNLETKVAASNLVIDALDPELGTPKDWQDGYFLSGLQTALHDKFVLGKGYENVKWDQTEFENAVERFAEGRDLKNPLTQGETE